MEKVILNSREFRYNYYLSIIKILSGNNLRVCGTSKSSTTHTSTKE